MVQFYRYVKYFKEQTAKTHKKYFTESHAWSRMQSRVAANDRSRLDAKVGKAICGCLDAGGVHEQDMLPLPRSVWAVEGGGGKDGEDNPWPTPLPKRRVYGQWRSSPESRQEWRHQHRHQLQALVRGKGSDSVNDR